MERNLAISALYLAPYLSLWLEISLYLPSQVSPLSPSTKKETIHYSYGSRRTTTETSRLSGEQELGETPYSWEKSYTPVGRVILKLQALKRYISSLALYTAL